MWLKALSVILFGVLGLALLTDWYVVDGVYDSVGRGIEHSIDAGIVHSGIVTDAERGSIQLEQSSLQSATKSEFIRYMGLSSNLENAIMKDSSFELNLNYDANGVPWIRVVFHTKVSFSLKDIQYPITVNRNIAFESIYN